MNHPAGDALRRAGALLCVGVRGAHPGDPQLEADLDLCASVGVGSIVLFDVDVPRYRALLGEGIEGSQARRAAVRNVHSSGSSSSPGTPWPNRSVTSVSSPVGLTIL